MSTDSPYIWDYQLVIETDDGKLKYAEMKNFRKPLRIGDRVGDVTVHAILDVRTVYEDGMVLEYEGDNAYTIEHPSIGV